MAVGVQTSQEVARPQNVQSEPQQASQLHAQPAATDPNVERLIRNMEANHARRTDTTGRINGMAEDSNSLPRLLEGFARDSCAFVLGSIKYGTDGLLGVGSQLTAPSTCKRVARAMPTVIIDDDEDADLHRRPENPYYRDLQRDSTGFLGGAGLSVPSTCSRVAKSSPTVIADDESASNDMAPQAPTAIPGSSPGEAAFEMVAPQPVSDERPAGSEPVGVGASLQNSSTQSEKAVSTALRAPAQAEFSRGGRRVGDTASALSCASTMNSSAAQLLGGVLAKSQKTETKPKTVVEEATAETDAGEWTAPAEAGRVGTDGLSGAEPARDRPSRGGRRAGDTASALSCASTMNSSAAQLLGSALAKPHKAEAAVASSETAEPARKAKGEAKTVITGLQGGSGSSAASALLGGVLKAQAQQKRRNDTMSSIA